MSTADDTPNPDDPFEPSDDPEHLDDLSRELDDLVDFANLEREMTEAANTTPSGPYAGQSAGERKRMEPPVGRVASVVPGHFGDRLTVTEAWPREAAAMRNRTDTVRLPAWLGVE